MFLRITRIVCLALLGACTSLAAGAPECLSDIDSDLQVDLDDWAIVADCLAGPIFPQDETCRPADFDMDADVDLKDYASLQNSFGVCPCIPQWTTGFEATGLNGIVYALTTYDDGTGPALYAGGRLADTEGASLSPVVKWNGAEWLPLGNGLDGRAFVLCTFDDGNGPALFAGGFFSIEGISSDSRIAKWDGSKWSVPGGGISIGSVYALTAYDDGKAPALYVGGSFARAGNIAANRVAKWDGANWSALGSGIGGFSFPTEPSSVFALTVFDDGNGPALYAGGRFAIAGAVPASNIAKWDGMVWTSPGEEFRSLNPPAAIYDLRVFQNETRGALYAAGRFATVGKVTANNIAKWDGENWSSLGSGMNGQVNSLSEFDDGAGKSLYAAGSFSTADGLKARNVAKWDGKKWSPLGDGINMNVWTLTVFENGGGPGLYAGGEFTMAGDLESRNIARWGCEQ